MRGLFPALLAGVLLFGLPGRCPAAELRLRPATIPAGGVALLEYLGPRPLLAVARIDEHLVYLAPGPEGATALVGADLELPARSRTIRAAVTGKDGRTRFHAVRLEVREQPRAEERLTLPKAMVAPQGPERLARIARERKRLLALLAGERPGPALAFRPPVDDPVSSPFGLRRILNGEPRAPHAGVDFRSPRGRPVRAPGEGTVVLAADLYFTGRTVVIDHGEGLFSLLAHLERSAVAAGRAVRAGEVVGAVGSTGRSTGPHLHWSVRLRGDRVDPLALLAVAGKDLDSGQAAGNN